MLESKQGSSGSQWDGFYYLAFPDQSTLNDTGRDTHRCACNGGEIVPGNPQNYNLQQISAALGVSLSVVLWSK